MITIDKIKCIKTISDNAFSVNFLLLLKDKRIASCACAGTIRIYDPSNDYHCDQVIQRHWEPIISICELDDGTIVSCSCSGTIIIGDYAIKNAHEFEINKVIALPDNRIASCSIDNTIKIWKSNPPYSDTPIKVLEGHDNGVRCLLYIKERDIMISGSEDEILRLWNMSTYQCVTVIEGVDCCWTHSLYQIDKDRVIVGGYYSFSIVNIDKFEIENTIKGSATCFLKLRDNKTILCGCDDGILLFYDMNTKEYKESSTLDSPISELLLIDDNTFLSCSRDYTIKVWQYK